MPFAMLSSKVVEYVRVTENCLGTIVASYEDDDKRKEGNLSDMARKTLTTSFSKTNFNALTDTLAYISFLCQTDCTYKQLVILC